MTDKHTIIIGDVHIGSSHFKRKSFHRFLDAIADPNLRLILNGDTMDNPRRDLSPEDQEMVRRIHPATADFETIWIEGNHDDAEIMLRKWDIAMHQQILLVEPGPPILIMHGACFDTVGKKLRHGVVVIQTMHHLRQRLGWSSLHFAEYAKRWRCLYRLMRNTVRKNALRHAREENAAVVVCGHVHSAEDSSHGDVRYLNSGAWTDPENHFIEIQAGQISLRHWPIAGGGGGTTNEHEKHLAVPLGCNTTKIG